MGYSNLIKVTLQNYNKFIELKTDTFIKDMVIASDEFLYVGTFKSIFKVNLKTGEQTILINNIGSEYARNMLLDSDGYLYVATANYIIWVNLETAQHSILVEISYIESIMLGSDGSLYIGNGSAEIFRLNLKTKKNIKISSFDDFGKIYSMVWSAAGYLYTWTKKTYIWKIAV
ncbi:hypothetical protein [Spiroplasma endosymbiont of Stenodema calcarata]|uniref:hypothetical protein n=1 Tax=Spiroplasma endosymbiont of Stenodema calcarata TaxID=3139328 RepID=UPI003CCAD5CA